MQNHSKTPGHRKKAGKAKYLIGFIALLVATIIGVVYLAQPKKTLVFLVSPGSVDKDGKLLGYKNFEAALNDKGIKLIPRVRASDEDQVTGLEIMMKDPSIDLTFRSNSGAKLPQEVLNQFKSLGVVRRDPLFVFGPQTETQVQGLRDLRGKNLALRALPGNGGKPTFSEDGAPASIYSGDYQKEALLNLVDITPKNTKLINTYPDPVLSNKNADFFMGSYDVSLQGRGNKLVNVLAEKNLKFLVLDDLNAIASFLPSFNVAILPVGGLSPALGIPDRPIPYLYSFPSVVVRSDIDSGLVMIICEALQQQFSHATWKQKKGEFPNFAATDDFEPHPIAVDYYKNGKPFLANYVSPTISAIIINILLILIPLATIIWPLTSLAPKIYSFYVKHKITHWYIDLELIDKTYESSTEEIKKQYREKLDSIRYGLAEMRLPVMHSHYAQELFAARAHIELLQRRINEADKKAEALAKPA